MDSEERRRLFAEQRVLRERRDKERAQRVLDAKPVREVSMSELHHDLRGVIANIRDGEIAVVSQRRRAVALIVPIIDESQLTSRDPATAVDLPALAEQFARRVSLRRDSEFAHGRWYGKEYRRYRRSRER
jgi:antitoxin (DNA-binding transcriptional repressor) of toxin-antitoxin stability system